MLTPRPGSNPVSTPDRQDVTFSGDITPSIEQDDDVTSLHVSASGVSVAQATMTATYKAPIPPPSFLVGYGEVDPTFPNRIMVVAEQNAATERRTVERAQVFQLVEALFSRSLSAVFAFGALAGSIYLAINGHDWVAGVIAGTTIVGVCTALVVGQRSKSYLDDPPDQN